MDVMHFGTPIWLKQAAGDPEFPEALERITTAMVERYRTQIHTWCPCNEPLVLALFSGDFGFWPPHSRKWKGYMPVLTRIVQAVSRSIRAIRRTDPQATVLHCDNVENYKTRDPSLQLEVRRRNLRRFLAMDMLTGRLDRNHPLFPWVTAYGTSWTWTGSGPTRSGRTCWGSTTTRTASGSSTVAPKASASGGPRRRSACTAWPRRTTAGTPCR
jgi:hypothetical protein